MRTRPQWCVGWIGPNRAASSFSLTGEFGQTAANTRTYHQSDSRWRTRDIHGDQFRQSKSSSKPDAVPPRDKNGAVRYTQHLPFQVFCCEAGTHVVDPAQSYYKGLKYRHGLDFHNASTSDAPPQRSPDASCLDSSQAWFCRDLWVDKALEGVQDDEGSESPFRYINTKTGPGAKYRRQIPLDPDANAGSDFDAMPDSELPLDELPPARLTVPNSAYTPARILINPRCVTTYAGVSHTQLALDLFGTGDDDGLQGNTTRNMLDDWEGAPESFVCQEQRYV